ncbi:MAG: hypothetical protein AABZ47_10770 [Planctomycetota bacterium]
MTTAARETIERRWWSRQKRDASLASMVTAKTASAEPFHRWLHLRQAFSPALVRRFLQEARLQDQSFGQYPVLDPFSGSGTTAIECGRNNQSALGVEASASMAFVTSTLCATRKFAAFPKFGALDSWQSLAASLSNPLHQTALMLAVARQYTSDGRLHKGAPPLSVLLPQMLANMEEDLRRPIPICNSIRRGDARDLSWLEADSIGGILTSPPYLSRYDYARIVRPMDEVYHSWYADSDSQAGPSLQLRAHSKAVVEGFITDGLPNTVTESMAALRREGEDRLATVTAAYFHDLFTVIRECARVLSRGAPFWLVMGGARVKGVYIPADLIAAEFAQTLGFEVDALLVARDLIDTGRKLGTLRSVSPRESVLTLRRV